ncbi:MAG: hypothetical protein AUH99_03675 [Candidatus Rokubacteria bacterium 13_2_20CM_2_70_11]|nr:MAG: hypothetical protein AUH99_03675 [Candidatus Rokubacteria bacterium 13_2_20CM_2_70_11]
MLNPVESTAKSVSIVRSGRLDSVMSDRRTGAIAGFSSTFRTALWQGVEPMKPRACASRRSDMNRRAESVE